MVWCRHRLVFAMVAVFAISASAFAALETDLEEGIGRWMAHAFIAQRGHLDQPPIADWINDLGQDLVAHSPRQRLTYRFVVLDSPEANGFALPGGWIFVTAGLLETMRSEDELAAVLAHELAHLAGRDFQQIVLHNAIYLGIAQLLKDADAGDWTPVVHAIQLVDGLRSSRRREAQADHTGAGIAWRAGYDPRAMKYFLGEDASWSYLQRIFATHPHPRERTEAIDQRFEELAAEDPAGLNRLAESLLERGRYAVATEILHRPVLAPQEAAREELLAAATARRVRTPAVGDGEAISGVRVARLRQDLEALDAGRDAAEEKRRLAWRRLERMWRDDQIQRALLYAQAIDPELNDPAYLALLVQTVHLMHRSTRGANLVARTLRMQASNTHGLRSLGESIAGIHASPDEVLLLDAAAAELQEAARALGQRTAEETSDLSRAAAEYHESGRIIALLLAELGLSGEGDPLGRLVFSRFMVIQTHVRMLALRLDRLDAVVERIAALQWSDAICMRRIELNVTAIEAGPDGRSLILDTVARRVRVTLDELEAAVADTGAVGDAALQLLREKVEPDDARFGSDLRAMQIILRIVSVETKDQLI